MERLLALSQNPRPHNAEQLAGYDAIWRLRVGDYRIVYTIQGDVLLVLVLRVGHRREIYRLVLPALALTVDEDEGGEPGS